MAFLLRVDWEQRHRPQNAVKADTAKKRKAGSKVQADVEVNVTAEGEPE